MRTWTAPYTEWGMVHIPHYRLTPALVPPTGGDWDVLAVFAGTFDGYQVEVAHMPAHVERGLAHFREARGLPSGLTELRTTLFGMQRWDHFAEWSAGGECDELRFCRALVDAIRAEVVVGRHRQPDARAESGIRDKAFNAFEIRRTIVEYWLKNIGASDDRLEPRWFEQFGDDEFRTHVRFSDAAKPTGVAKGDRLLFSAAVRNQDERRLVAAVRVSSDAPEYAPRTPSDGWPWKLAITPLVVVPLAGLAPTPAAIGITSALQGSHKRIEPSQFETAIRLMGEAALH
jgi:hypothetical protein